MEKRISTTPDDGPVVQPAEKPTETPAPPPPHSRRGWVWILLIVLLVAGYYVWSRVWQPHAQSATNATPAKGAGRGGQSQGGSTLPVVAARATRGNIGVYVTGLGAVTPIYTVTIKSRVDGQLMSVHFKEGEMVHQGDLLVEIDPRPYQAVLEQAEGNLTRDQALLANSRIDLTRYTTLLGQNGIPEQQVATQKALVTQYEGTVKTDQGAIDAAKVNVTYCNITAPISGLVGLRLVDPGNIVHAADTNGMLVITQMQPISAIFTISEDQLPPVLGKYRAGQSLIVDAYDRDMKMRLAEGRLTHIDNQIDPSTGTLKLRAEFDNRNNELFPNQFVNARLLVQEKYGVTLLPTAAIQRNAQSTYVYLVKPDSTVTIRPISTGVTEGDLTEVASGLAPRDEVVMTGVDKLQEGTKVNAQVPGEQPAGAAQGRPGGSTGKSRKGPQPR